MDVEPKDGLKNQPALKDDRADWLSKTKIVLCVTLVLLTIAFNFKHVWDLIQIAPQSRQALAVTFYSEVVIVSILVADLVASGLFLFRPTFKAGVVLQALTVFMVIGLQLKAGQTRIAVEQIPFLIATAVMFYLGYPFE